MANDNSYQRRADKGGEVGPNGEHYKGGQFIATSEDTVKGGSQTWEPRPKTEWELNRDAEIAAKAAAHEAWLASRVAQFAALLAVLEAGPLDQGIYETFWQSLGRQLRQWGHLTPRQAPHALKAFFGRRNKANAEAWDTLEEALTQKE